MILLDEPYRWAEAVANRRDYIEDQLRSGSPVVGLNYRDGVLLLTLGRGQQKIFEVYDRIAMGAVGHPTDIEKLRQAAIDLAHVIGFNYSEADVTLQQIVHFGLGPAVKTAFDEVVRSPYIARVLLAELEDPEKAVVFYTVDYDGGFQRTEAQGVLGGIPEADRVMQRRLAGVDTARMGLRDALDAALGVWAAGRWAGQLEEMPNEALELDRAADEADVTGVLRDALGSLEVEAAVLQRSRTGNNKFRALAPREIAPVVKAYRGSES